MGKEQLANYINGKGKKVSTGMLCEIFVQTNSWPMEKKETPIIRGIIMDLLEKKNPDAFSEWLDTDDVELIDDPTGFFKSKEYKGNNDSEKEGNRIVDIKANNHDGY